MTRKHPLLALLTLLVAAACGGGAAATAAPTTVNFAMAAQNGSKAIGTGQVVESSGSFTVTVKLTGLVPGSIHVSHVHAGSCSAPGGIAYALQSVVADSAGSATTTSTIPVGYAIPASGWYVNVHHGPDFTEPGYAPSDSCGDMPAK
jgi:Cu/Zn superoxide dismutase